MDLCQNGTKKVPKDTSGGRQVACAAVFVDSGSRRARRPSASVRHGREIDNLDEVRR